MRRRSSQQGVGLMAAIFLIVVVALLVVAITRMVRTSSQAFTQDLVTQRADLAAQSGAQLALNRVFAPAGVGSCGAWSWDLSSVGLNHCRADVACHTELVGSDPLYTLESSGRCDVGDYVAERQVLVKAVP